MALLALLLLAGIADPWPPLDPTATAFVDVRVVTMDGVVHEHGTVVVRDGLIAAVGAAGEVGVPLDARVVTGEDLTLMPGLVDMHVHLNASTVADYVAHGVTTVRNMWGFANLPFVMDRVRRDELTGPVVLSASNGIDGNPPSWPEALVLEDPRDADELVRRQKEAGWVAIKLYQRLRGDVYEALLEAAKRHGIPAVGHVPTASSVEVALAGGQASIEHMGGYERALSGVGAIGLGGWTDVHAERMEEWAARTAQAGTSICPTQVIFATVTRNAGDRADLVKAMENRRLMIGAFHRAGVRLLAGSDAGVGGTVAPGAGLLEELELLVAAGLTPEAALAAATSSAADFLHREGEFGRIRAGLRADLLLLHGDPRVDITAVRRQAGLMLRGRWIQRQASPGSVYSWRNATIGSTCAARRAGSQLARKAIAPRSSATPPNVSGSVPLTPTSCDSSRRPTPSAAASPIPSPVRTSRSARSSTSASTSRRAAPSATRTPISRTRRLTEYASVP
jgi:imidazolonepropionase-like amidohydrolase